MSLTRLIWAKLAYPYHKMRGFFTVSKYSSNLEDASEEDLLHAEEVLTRWTITTGIATVLLAVIIVLIWR